MNKFQEILQIKFDTSGFFLFLFLKNNNKHFS